LDKRICPTANKKCERERREQVASCFGFWVSSRPEEMERRAPDLSMDYSSGLAGKLHLLVENITHTFLVLLKAYHALVRVSKMQTYRVYQF
jgi:hypothetical protein